MKTTPRADTGTVTQTFLFKRYRNPPKGFGEAEANLIDPAVQREIATAVKNQKWPLYMFGTQGSGKSCAAACLYMACQGEELEAKWHSTDELVQDVIRCRQGPGYIEIPHPTMGTFQRYEKRIFEIFETARFVVMDELGSRKLTESGYEILKRFVDSRHGKPTVYTSNLGPKQLEEVYDKRLVSRVCEGTIIKFTGEDRRWANNVRVEV